MRQKTRQIRSRQTRFQSTHPLRGATRRPPRGSPAWAFQSTHPLRGATAHFLCLRRDDVIFQSTHPLRGATGGRPPQPPAPCISIHAPLAGCDLDLANPAAPAQISIHAPLAGCDLLGTVDLSTVEVISIHAPLAGCDRRAAGAQNGQGDFNPRTPCGVRRSRAWAPDRPPSAFQSTHPLRGATAR